MASTASTSGTGSSAATNAKGSTASNATLPALRSLEYWAYQYRRTWRGSLISSFLSPVLYLAALGVGLGSLINNNGNPGHHLGGVPYLAFLAPGLLAAAAMQTAANESSYPVLGAIKWIRTYHAMLATPLRVIDVLLGHLAWVALRLLMGTTIFLGVMAAFGATESWWALLTVPAGVLTGLSFAAPIMAFAASQDNDARFAALFRFVIVPMFLFSGTFFPVSQLPAFMRPIAYATPLWHGVDLCRTLALGTASVMRTALHTLYLLGWVLGGIALARRAYQRRLVD